MKILLTIMLVTFTVAFLESKLNVTTARRDINETWELIRGFCAIVFGVCLITVLLILIWR